MARSTITTWLLLAVFVGLPLAQGCGDEAEEAALCEVTAARLCDKWFECFPMISKGSWGTADSCKSKLEVWCADSEALLACDVNNAQIAQCRDELPTSACGELPASCTKIYDCYDDA